MFQLPNLSDYFARDPEAIRRLGAATGSFAVNLLIAAVILAVTFWLAGFIKRSVQRGVSRVGRKHPVDSTLPVFIGSLARYIIVIIGLIAVFQQLGVQTTSIIAVLGAASLAIGLALQGTLANVAAGVMLLILRPYRVGDNVEINGRAGKVRQLDLFTTELTSYDGLKMVLPNGKVLGELIVNFSARGTRRFEVRFTIDSGDDLDKAIGLLLRLADEDERIRDDPPPWAKVVDFAPEGVVLMLRCWVKASDFVDAQPDMVKTILERFTAEGFRFPYPHQVAVPFEVAHPEVPVPEGASAP